MENGQNRLTLFNANKRRKVEGGYDSPSSSSSGQAKAIREGKEKKERVERDIEAMVKRFMSASKFDDKKRIEERVRGCLETNSSLLDFSPGEFNLTLTF